MKVTTPTATSTACMSPRAEMTARSYEVVRPARTAVFRDPFARPSGRSGGRFERSGRLREHAAVSSREVPHLDPWRLDAEGREGRADLASVVGSVVQRLGEPNAERRV